LTPLSFANMLVKKNNYAKFEGEPKEVIYAVRLKMAYPFSCGQVCHSLKTKEHQKSYSANSYYLAKPLYKLRKNLYTYIFKGHLL
jgi:hypothetical protein